VGEGWNSLLEWSAPALSLKMPNSIGIFLTLDSSSNTIRKSKTPIFMGVSLIFWNHYSERGLKENIGISDRECGGGL
jgi:hypothetical protein